jgi:excisionase family DNA binding protein
MELLTIREAARKTKLSEGWWRQRIFHKEVAFVKLGRRVLIPETTNERLVRDGTVEPSGKGAGER